jgi:integrase
MSSAVRLLDTAGRRRSPATLSEFHAGRAPGNKDQRYAADPPTVDEIIAVMRHAAHARYGNRLNGLIVVLWRAGLRINEALSLTETDPEEQRGSVLVRHGKNDRRRQVGARALPPLDDRHLPARHLLGGDHLHGPRPARADDARQRGPCPISTPMRERMTRSRDPANRPPRADNRVVPKQQPATTGPGVAMR